MGESEDVSEKRLYERSRAYYDYYIAEQRAAQQYETDLAKWLLASLVLVNGGAIALLASNEGTNAQAALQRSGAYFACGIITAILCGTVAWLNAGIRDMYFDRLAKPEMLGSAHEEDWPKPSSSMHRAMNATFFGSLIFGLASLALFAIGAFRAGARF